LGVAFAVLISLLAGIGEFGLRRMQAIDESRGDITGRLFTNLELARRALAISNDNDRIVMQIVFGKNRALVETLLATRSENSKEITRLLEESERRCESEKEKQLLAAVKRTREPYLESYLRAIHLLVAQGKQDEARAVIINETLTAVREYHAAWNEFVEFQNNEVRVAAKQAQVNYAKAHRLVVLLVALAIAVALVIAVFITRHSQKSFRQEAAAQAGVEFELQRSEERMRMAMAAAKMGFWDLDVIKDEHVWSNTCKALLGVPLDSQPNFQSLMNAVHPDDWKTMRAEIDGATQEKRPYVVEFRVVWPDDSVHWRTSSGQAFYDDKGQVIRMSGITMDIDERKVVEERVQFLAYYDSLTRLPNRALFRDRLSNALAEARRQKEKVALLFLDLDKFKHINDSLGHEVGDLLLQGTAARLTTWGREQDTIARFGGDEFLIALTHIKEVPDVAVAAERLMNAMAVEFVIQGHSLNISCSIGISLFPEHGADCGTLIKNADAAMYRAKADGRNNFRFFTEDMNAQAVERLTLESSLRSALAKNELFLMYQPQIDIATGRITGLEALLRWQHPELGRVPPDKFIRIAENSGLILPIGEWVLRTACLQARAWQDEGLPALTVAVNVSAVQFRQDGFCELVRSVLRETGLAPQHLELELTESLLFANADATLSVIRELKAIGVTIAIDDFGIGYSNFSYLKRLRISKLKIDRSLIQDIGVNPDDAAITIAIISMAKSLHLRVIAEGVENEAQMSFLRKHRCNEIQGYYFSKPLAVEEVASKLRGDSPEPHARAQAGGEQA
jgi:diguanylate cyclase (GGDEF)-like protein